ncbi:HEAT repeat domain-containing protein [Nocardia sp. NPDC056000]|uniref:HEAT repeat domain-containing protein n=1 Tax=Nocardia sp. NPDC056000 TaxID=3345674 RepID=UPI0035E14EEE
MSIDDAIAELESAEEHRRQAAVRTLIGAGRQAIPAMLRGLRESDSTSTADACARVLTGLGPLAYRPLVELLAGMRAEPGAAAIAARLESRLCRLLGLATLDQAIEYSEGIRVGAEYSPRYRVACDIGDNGRTEYGFVLAALLDDEEDNVRKAAARSFAALGTDVAPLLRRIRRSPLPARHMALQALAEIGWHTLDSEDLRLLHRFVTSESAREAPLNPVVMKSLWWALPTGDQGAVLEAFGLSDPVPATIAMGRAVAKRNGSINELDFERVYVSAALDGWTLVFGDPTSHIPRDEQRIREYLDDEFTRGLFELHCDDMKERVLERVARPSIDERCAELSSQFGAAHYYKNSDAYDWGGWCIAENGEILRRAYRGDDLCDLDLEGDPHPSEQGLELESVGVSRIADSASVGPRSLGPDSRVTGHGVLALTARGREVGGHRGSLPLTLTAYAPSIRPLG